MIHMTVEQLKLILSNNFKNFKDELAMGFLKEVVGTAGYRRFHRDSNILEFYKPIYVPEYRLTFTVTTLADPAGNPYNEVTFSEDQNEPKEQHFVLNELYYPTEKYTSKIDVEYDVIVVEVMGKDYGIDTNYRLKSELYGTSHKLFIDLGGRKYTWDAPESEEIIRRYLSEYNFSGHDASPFLQKVANASAYSETFAKLVEEYHLASFQKFVDQPRVLVYTLIQLIVRPYVKALLASEPWFSLFTDNNGSYHSFQAVENDTLYFPGEDVCTILGFPKVFNGFIQGRNLEEMRFNHIAQCFDLSDAIKSIAKTRSIDDEVEANTIISLLRASRWSGYNNVAMGRMLFMFDRGYAPQELLQYLLKAERRQAISMEDGFNILFDLIVRREQLTGEKKKFFPKYLKVSHDVFNRDFGLMVNAALSGESTKLLENINKRKLNLVEDGSDYEIVAQSTHELCETDLISAAHNGHDIMYYKKKRGSKYVQIKLIGNTVQELSEKLPEKHLENLKKWMDKNDLVPRNQFMFN